MSKICLPAASSTPLPLILGKFAFLCLSAAFLTLVPYSNLNAQTPGAVAGSVFWVSADVGVTGTTNVNPWADRSGTSNNAVQPTPANQPSLVVGSVNFNPAINFPGSTTIMSPTTPPANLNSTIFTVGAPTINTAYRTMFRGSVSDHPILVETGNDRLGYYDNDNGQFQNSGFTWKQNEFSVVGLEMRAANVNFRKNGTQGSTIATVNLSGLNINYFGNYQGNGQPFGRIAEAIIFNTASALTTQEKNRVESYLAVKYGVSLTHNYLATNNTVTWDVTANATYSNDIAGIGRDDGTGLSQQKSLSVNTGAGVALDKGTTFGTNRDFILWGSDAGTGTSFNIPSTYSLRTNRVWKVAVTGTPGTVTFTADLSALGMPNTGIAANYALLKDTDNDFSAGATAHTTGASIVGNTLTFTAVSFSNNDTFTIAASGLALPGGVAGALFWVKAGVGVTGTTNISNWADQSGFANHATQAVSANQPALVTNDLNFNPTVNFPGSTSILSITTPPADANSTVFTVGIPTINTNYRTILRGAVSDHPMLGETGTNRFGYYDNDNIGFLYSGFDWAQNEPAVMAVEMRTANVNFRKNGTQGSTLSTVNLTGLNMDYFGNYQGNGQNFGRIAETIIFNTPSAALTTTDKNKIESYLAVKYGLTLTHNYLATNGTVTWDVTANAGYNSDIGGIGRDDATGLDQRKSLSVNTNAGITLDKGALMATDRNFIVWGGDGSTGTSANVLPAYTLRSKRIWKTAVTGAPGAVTISINLSALGLPNTGNVADYALLKDTDTDFSSGSTAVTTSASLVGSVLSFSVTFANNDLFSIAIANVTLPGGVAGLNVWLKADLGPEKSPGVAAGNGDAISLWKDKSGQIHDYTVAVGPTLQSSTLNFNPTVEIINGGFDAPAGSELSNDWTTFFISKKLASDQDGRVFEGHTGNNLWAHWGTFTNSIYLEGIPSEFNSGIATATGIQNWHLHSYKRESAGTTLEARADGTLLKTFASSNSASTIRIDIEAGNYAGTEHSNARVGEMIVYNTALTTTEIQKVESYLAVKYGLTLAHDYLAANGTKTWDVTANAGYNTNIAGIGRDDNTALDQRKSVSTNTGGADVTMDKGAAFGTNSNFIIWGSNGTTGTSTNISSSYTLRSARIWKAAVTGAPGTVSFSIDLSVVGLPNTGTATDYAILKDTDTDFSTGSTPHTVGASLVGNILSFTGVSLANNNFFSIAAANVILPGGIAGLNVWLKSDLGPEKSPGVPAGNNDAISLWKDKSGQVHDYTVVAGPTLKTSILNFNPTVEIITGGFDAPAGSELSNNWTTFFVSRKLASDQDGRVFDSNTGNNLWAHWGVYTNSLYLEGVPSEYNSGIATTTGIQNWHLHAYKRESVGTTMEARADGVTLKNFASSNNSSGVRIDIEQGNYSAGAEHSNAQVGEMIVYNSYLTATEVQKVESYLAVKYGMTLSHDYLATDGTKIWDAAVNAAYGARITGIGRDNSTGLDQRKSLSINAGAYVQMDKGGAFGTDKSYIIWGDNNQAMQAGTTDYPAGFVARLARVWKLGLIGTPGAVTVQFDLSTVPGSKTAADLRLIVDRNKNGAFIDETVGGGGVISGAVSLGGGVFQFSGVTFNDGELITIGSVNSNTPLPITLVSFTGSQIKNKVVLSWTTASEVNNDYFTLEKSLTGAEFGKLARVQGAGNSTVTKKYTYTDENPVEGINYYRLRQTDFDGASVLSKIVAVNVKLEPLPTYDWDIYPNPTSGQFIIDGIGLEGSMLTITNSLGQKMLIDAGFKDGKISVDATTLPKGMYVVTVTTGERVTSRRMIVN